MAGGATWNCCHLGAISVYTIQPCTCFECHCIRNHIRRVHVCLAVTGHLHFWQNGRDPWRATAVTRGWNGCRNKSQHRKMIPEKKIVPPFLPGLEPAPFRSRVPHYNHWAIPAPQQPQYAHTRKWMIFFQHEAGLLPNAVIDRTRATCRKWRRYESAFNAISGDACLLGTEHPFDVRQWIFINWPQPCSFPDVSCP